MTIENGYITQATVSELFSYYLRRDYDDVIPFDEYMRRMEESGVIITDKEDTE